MPPYSDPCELQVGLLVRLVGAISYLSSSRLLPYGSSIQLPTTRPDVQALIGNLTHIGMGAVRGRETHHGVPGPRKADCASLPLPKQAATSAEKTATLSSTEVRCFEVRTNRRGACIALMPAGGCSLQRGGPLSREVRERRAPVYQSLWIGAEMCDESGWS